MLATSQHIYDLLRTRVHTLIMQFYGKSIITYNSTLDTKLLKVVSSSRGKSPSLV